MFSDFSHGEIEIKFKLTVCKFSNTIFIVSYRMLITDRICSMTGRLCFDTCLSIHPSTCLSVCPQGGVPQPGPAGGFPLPGGTPPQLPPSQVWWDVHEVGYPPSRDEVLPSQVWLGGITPIQDNRWSTWFAAVGMPLAFTQEDFLV